MIGTVSVLLKCPKCGAATLEAALLTGELGNMGGVFHCPNCSWQGDIEFLEAGTDHETHPVCEMGKMDAEYIRSAKPYAIEAMRHYLLAYEKEPAISQHDLAECAWMMADAMMEEERRRIK